MESIRIHYQLYISCNILGLQIFVERENQKENFAENQKIQCYQSSL